MDTDDDRRGAPRERAAIAAEIRVGDAPPALGVMLDASERGVSLVTGSRVEVGQRVALGLQVAGEVRIDVEGTVARVEPHERPSRWRFRVGVALDAPHPELARRAAAIRERLARG